MGSGCRAAKVIAAMRTDPASSNPQCSHAEIKFFQGQQRLQVLVQQPAHRHHPSICWVILIRKQYLSKTLALRLSSGSICLIRLHCQLSFKRQVIISV